MGSDSLKKDDGYYKYSENAEYDGVRFALLMARRKVFVLSFVAVALVASLIVSFLLPKWYKAEANLVPSKSKSSVFENLLSGGLGSALKNFGLTKLTGQSGDNYDFIVFMQSRTVKDSLIDKFDLAKEYDIPDTLRSKIYDELESNMDITYEKEGNYTVAIESKDRRKAKRMVEYFVEVVNRLAAKVAKQDAALSAKYLARRLEQTDSTLDAISRELGKYSKKNFLISFKDQAKAISEAYSDLKSELIKQETLLEILKNRYGDKDPYSLMQKDLVDKLRSQLKKAENEPGFAGNFPLTEAASVGMKYLRMLAEFEAFSKVKAFLLPMLEETKLNEKREAVSLIVVDPPRLPDKKSRPKRALIVVGSVVGAFVLALIFVALEDGYKRFKARYKEFEQS